MDIGRQLLLQAVLIFFNAFFAMTEIAVISLNPAKLRRMAEEIARYNIPIGTFDTVSECKYEVPTATAIGKVYQELALEESKKMSVAKAILHVFSSFLSDAISNFNSDVYYQNSSYLQACYDSGALLD